MKCLTHGSYCIPCCLWDLIFNTWEFVLLAGIQCYVAKWDHDQKNYTTQKNTIRLVPIFCIISPLPALFLGGGGIWFWQVPYSHIWSSAPEVQPPPFLPPQWSGTHHRSQKTAGPCTGLMHMRSKLSVKPEGFTDGSHYLQCLRHAPEADGWIGLGWSPHISKTIKILLDLKASGPFLSDMYIRHVHCSVLMRVALHYSSPFL